MNLTPTHHQAAPGAGDQPDLGVAARAVNATKVYGTGDAEARALDGVTVGFAAGFLCIVARTLALTAAAVMVLVGTTYDRLRRPRASLDTIVARRVRRAFERLGPPFINAGQLMSSSFGSLPKVRVEETAALPRRGGGRAMPDNRPTFAICEQSDQGNFRDISDSPTGRPKPMLVPMTACVLPTRGGIRR